MLSKKTPKTAPIACFGEILWDALEHGLFLGGAPTNVAYNTARLGHPSLLISSIGNDELGRQAVKRIENAKVDVSCVQISNALPTGVADIFLDENKDADYNIQSPSAWDEIEYTQLTQEKLADCSAIVFGSLACRSETSRTTLETLLASFTGLKVCDINIRKPWNDPDFLLRIAKQANILKLNEDELFYLSDTTHTSDNTEKALKRLSDLCNCKMIAVTRGSSPAIFYDGATTLYCETETTEGVVDTIGAGDAFSAGFVTAMAECLPAGEALRRGVQMGGIVATHSGAQPDYSIP